MGSIKLKNCGGGSWTKEKRSIIITTKASNNMSNARSPPESPCAHFCCLPMQRNHDWERIMWPNNTKDMEFDEITFFHYDGCCLASATNDTHNEICRKINNNVALCSTSFKRSFRGREGNGHVKTQSTKILGKVCPSI